MESRKRGRPKLNRQVKNVSLDIEPEAWEGLRQKALAMGYRSRTQLLTAIANGEVTMEQIAAATIQEVEQQETLGE
jgi:hypothetical protein